MKWGGNNYRRNWHLQCTLEIYNTVLHIEATASLNSKRKCKELNIPVLSMAHRAIQVDGAKLNVVGKIHMAVYRDKL